MKHKKLYFALAALVLIAPWVFVLHHSAHSPFTADATKLSPQQQLGQLIFDDTHLSEPQGMSCATCHEPDKAFQGNNRSMILAVAKGSREGHFGARNVPTLTYVSFSPTFQFSKEKNEKTGKEEWQASGGQFLDGRAKDLASQIEGPLLDVNEMNNPSKQAVVDKVKTAVYAPRIQQLYGEDIFAHTDKAFTVISNLLAAFESSPAFAPFSSKFDRVLQGKDQFTPQEARGFELFKDPQKGNCMACHVGKPESHDPHDWLFTDYTYDNLGIPRNPHLPKNQDGKYYDLGLCKQPGLEKTLPKDLKADSLCGAFKVPTLRNIALTAPYGHNGYFENLRDVVKFYATRDTNPEQWYPKDASGKVQKYDDLPAEYHENVNIDEVPYDRKPGEKPRYSDQETDDLVAFLKTLTDE